MKTEENDRLLDMVGLADYLGMSPQTIRIRRMKGELPPAIKIGRFVRFRMSDVEAWLDGQLEDAA